MILGAEFVGIGRKGPGSWGNGRPLETGKGKKMNFPLGTSRRKQPCCHLDFGPSETAFGLLAFKTLRDQTDIIVSHQMCGNLLQKQWETNTDGELVKSV